MKYTEQDLRKAFQAGEQYGGLPFSSDKYVLTEDEYIDSLKSQIKVEEKVCFSYSFLRRKLDWMEFCELTGVNEYARRDGFEIKDHEIFIVTESKAKQFKLI